MARSRPVDMSRFKPFPKRGSRLPPKTQSQPTKRADYEQLNVRLSPEGWRILDSIKSAMGNLAATQVIEIVLREKFRALDLHLPPTPVKLTTPPVKLTATIKPDFEDDEDFNP